MCGIVGLFHRTTATPISEETLRKMLARVRHRGPDQFGLYINGQVGLGSARLSIIDVAGGQQPISNENGEIWIVFNGEIYNYPSLRAKLEAQGHRFRTQSDTEVVLHLYEEHGPGCLSLLNGQFAIAIWDNTRARLFLARDRVGIRPLFYAQSNGALIFGSEMKAILADSRVQAEIDPVALDQIFTYWSTLSPYTIFKEIKEVPAGHYLLVDEEELVLKRYYQVDFPAAGNNLSLPGSPVPVSPNWPSKEDYLDAFRLLLIEATRIRLRADVPVGAYLSGGIDSSIIAAIVRTYCDAPLDTFSIAFTDSEFDESQYQQHMAAFLGTEHQVVHASYADIAEAFPDVMWHVETPIMRTSPAPLFLLSKLVHEHGYKVVLTGEGADEILAGYNIFKEAKIRHFWARCPNSSLRPRLLERLYPYVADLQKGSKAYLYAFFRKGLEHVDGHTYSHAIRWQNNGRSTRFFSEDVRASLELAPASHEQAISFPDGFETWDPLSKAQYLEFTIFMSQYLLSSQGDRVAMAHSVEGRFPFLDHRMIEFCNYLPPDQKLLGLSEKRLLRQLGRELLPDEIWQRPKRPYRAPIHRVFMQDNAASYVKELLSQERIIAAGLFDAGRVDAMLKKAKASHRLSETDDMALVGILSTQLVHEMYIANPRRITPLSQAEDIKQCVQERVQ